MSKVKSIVAAALTLAAVGSAAQAYTFTIIPTLGQEYNSAFQQVPTVSNPGAPRYVTVNFSFTIGSLGANQGGFADTVFDINLTPGAPGLTTGFGYSPATTVTYQTNPFPGATQISDYASNGDQGQSSSDLKAITVYLANPPYNGYSSTGGADPRATLGQSGPVLLGSALLLWDGVTPEVISLGNVQAATYDLTDNNFSTKDDFIDTNTIVLGSPVATPEPASLGVLALGGIALLNRRRKA